MVVSPRCSRPILTPVSLPILSCSRLRSTAWALGETMTC